MEISPCCPRTRVNPLVETAATDAGDSAGTRWGQAADMGSPLWGAGRVEIQVADAVNRHQAGLAPLIESKTPRLSY